MEMSVGRRVASGLQRQSVCVEERGRRFRDEGSEGSEGDDGGKDTRPCAFVLCGLRLVCESQKCGWSICWAPWLLDLVFIAILPVALSLKGKELGTSSRLRDRAAGATFRAPSPLMGAVHVLTRVGEYTTVLRVLPADSDLSQPQS